MNSNQKIMKNRNEAKIVIIGAGISGIAAAERLLSLGFSDVTILEAEGRVGGRIFTREFGKGFIDMGAQWIHGQMSNPVYELACRHDLVDIEAQEAATMKSLQFCMSNGQAIPASVNSETSSALDNIFNEMTKFSREGTEVGDETVGDYVQAQFYKSLEGEMDESLKRMKEGLFHWRLIMEKTENACSSIYDMSLGAWGEYLECAGIDAVELSHGYQPVLDLFLANIPPSSIHLNTRVQHIYWNNAAEKINENESCDKSYRTTKCNIMTNDGKAFEADHVIFTASLGFLKANAQSVFTPSLPQDKMSAIECLGFGTVNKIYLEFEDSFWRNQCKGIQFVWFPEDKIELNCLESLSNEDKDLVDAAGEWYKAVHGFDVVAQHPDNLLCGWIAGVEAERMEALPDHIVLDVCHELLGRFTGKDNLPRPVKIIRSSWRSGALSYGSYSYRHTGSTARDSCTLAKPLYSTSTDVLNSSAEPLVMFAGEATHDTYFSTTHGALLSGQREAERLAEYYTAAENTKHSPSVHQIELQCDDIEYRASKLSALGKDIDPDRTNVEICNAADSLINGLSKLSAN